MQKVKLLGEMGRKFGPEWKTRCSNIRDIFLLIECQQPTFKRYLLDCEDAGVGFEIKRGEELLESSEDLLLELGEEDIVIAPIPAGAKGGAGKLVAAAAIIAVTIATGGLGTAGFAAGAAGTAATVATAIAVNLAITGLTELLAPGPGKNEGNEGYLFNGPVNTVQQGLPVPVCYGELVVGGAPINVSFRPQPFRLAGGNFSSPVSSYYGPLTGPYAHLVFSGVPGAGGFFTFSEDLMRELNIV